MVCTIQPIALHSSVTNNKKELNTYCLRRASSWILLHVPAKNVYCFADDTIDSGSHSVLLPWHVTLSSGTRTCHFRVFKACTLIVTM